VHLDDRITAAATPASRVQEFATVTWGGLSLVVINDMHGRYLPLSKLILGAAQTTVKGSDGVWAFDVAMGIEANFFNPTISYWEPILERTQVRVMWCTMLCVCV
jgi:hypothetical protein